MFDQDGEVLQWFSQNVRLFQADALQFLRELIVDGAGVDKEAGARSGMMEFENEAVPIHAGKTHIHNRDVARLDLTSIESLLGAATGNDLEVMVFEKTTQAPTHRDLVVDDQYAMSGTVIQTGYLLSSFTLPRALAPVILPEAGES